ncbi:MAG TPA: hypothetical protein VGG30_10710 [Pirellulales bacterium]
MSEALTTDPDVVYSPIVPLLPSKKKTKRVNILRQQSARRVLDAFNSTGDRMNGGRC